jgi:sugar lactone lactonase YvrE
MVSPMAEVRTVLDGLVFGEGPRWHDGALWFSDMHANRVVRTVLDGTSETVVAVEDDEPSGLGWLPDGRLLVVAMESGRLLRLEPDGRLVTHADLSDRVRGSLNDMIVGADGTAYVGDMGMRIQADGTMNRQPGQTFRVGPDGSVTQAADDLAAPNGHALTDDGRTLIVAESAGACLTAYDVAPDGSLSGRRVYAALTPAAGARVAAPDGFCIDAEGAAWVADPVGARVFRVLPGGSVTDEIGFEGEMPVACVLGGEGRRTLLMCVAKSWKRDEARKAPLARIDAATVAVPGAGRP